MAGRRHHRRPVACRLRRRHARPDELGRALSRLEHAADLDTVRGIEGDQAKRYFAALPP